MITIGNSNIIDVKCLFLGFTQVKNALMRSSPVTSHIGFVFYSTNTSHLHDLKHFIDGCFISASILRKSTEIHRPFFL